MDHRSSALVLARRRVRQLPPADRVDALLAAPRGAELVRSLPAQEFYLTVVEAGLDVALPLLGMASTHQLEFLFDIDAWNKDAFDPARAAHWFGALHESDPESVVRWLREADEELVVLALSHLLRVYKADESTDQPFWPPDRPVPTLDNLYFLELRDEVPDQAFPALWEGLTRLRSRDRSAYEALLEQVLWSVPAELEEDNYRKRGARLAEKGFPEFEEAMEVWAAGPESVPDVRARAAAAVRDLPPVSAGGGERLLPAPVAEMGLTTLGEGARALDDDTRERLWSDLVRLGNRYAVASGSPLGEPETHRDGLDSALSLVNLGLTELCGDRGDLAAGALAGLSVFDLNRAGVGAVLQRAARARRLAGGWLKRVPHGWERLDESLREALEGLLGPRPQFTIALAERPFRAPADLVAVDAVLDTVEALGAFLETTLGAGAAGQPELESLASRGVAASETDWSSVALTSIARVALGDGPRPVPVSPAEGATSLSTLLDGDPRVVTDRFREIAADLGLGKAARFLGALLEDEAASLLPGEEPDPRLVRTLLFR